MRIRPDVIQAYSNGTTDCEGQEMTESIWLKVTRSKESCSRAEGSCFGDASCLSPLKG